MLKNPLTDTLDPPLSPEELSKANQGFSHPFTAMLLCPHKLRAGFVKNPTKNPLLIWAAILFGESKALTSIKDFFHAPRKSNACNNGIKGIEPSFIAMICCQVHFALSSMESWEVTDGDFRYDMFCHDIMMRFENGEDSWGAETLQQVFGPAPNNDSDENGDDSDADPADKNEQLACTQKERIMVKKATEAPANAEGC
ncbi:hypothetical protein VKT23_020081 [Stygiomarasmius scandens]|uniref:Uncharacterized protein n=1 Tax=Marasmiellus scandens TaxID=2682957 RepID=A0ABR1IMI4_9AGAR